MKQVVGGNGWMDLPNGVREWHPKKDGSYFLDILPYPVAIDNRLDKKPEKEARRFPLKHRCRDGPGFQL